VRIGYSMSATSPLCRQQIPNEHLYSPSPQDKRQIRNKSVTSWPTQKSVGSVVSCRFPDSITTTCCQLGNFPFPVSINRSIILRGSYGETWLMDFGHFALPPAWSHHWESNYPRLKHLSVAMVTINFIDELSPYSSTDISVYRHAQLMRSLTRHQWKVENWKC